MRKQEKILGWNMLLIAGIFLALLPIAFSVPNEISLQGKLTSANGYSASGTYNMSFKIYDSFTNGTILYEVEQNITTNANGIYDAILRNINLNFSGQYYLGITVSTDEESVPRINLTSSPYAFRSNISEGLNPANAYAVSSLTSTAALSVNNTLFVNGSRVGVGTTSPGYALDVVGNSALWQSVYGTEDGLLAYWPLSEGSGSKVYDHGPNGKDATLHTTTTASWSSGKYGSAMNFVAGSGSGTKDFLSDASVVPAGTLTGLTAELWFNSTNSSTASNGRLIGKYAYGSWAPGFLVTVINGQDTIYFTIGDSDQVTISATKPNAGLFDGVWHHLVFTWDGSTIVMYKDGLPIASNSTSSFTGSVTGDWRISVGGRDGTNDVSGNVDEVRVYNRALSPDEVKAHYLRSGTPNLATGIFRVVSTNNSETFRVTNNGTVGIGTSTPTEKLTVIGNVSITGNVTIGQRLSFMFGNLIDNFASGFLRLTGNVVIASNLTVGDNALFVNANDTLVGIGTSTPNATLDVVGNEIRLTQSANQANGLTLEQTATGGAGSPRIMFFADNNNTFGNAIYRNPSFPGLVFLTGSQKGETSGTERMVLSDRGYLGIGTIEPTSSLTVFGNFSTTTGALLATSSGNVGIGTTSPNYLLQVASGTDGKNVNLSNALYVNGSRVGIGTSTPASLLDVNGILQVTKKSYVTPVGSGGIEFAFYISDEGGIISYDRSVSAYRPLYIDGSKILLNPGSGGNVGIGTSSPNDQLEVIGNVRVSGSLNATAINASRISAVSYDIGWTNLSNYPSACPSGQVVSAIGDTLTCVDVAAVSSSAGGWNNDSTNTYTSRNVVVEALTFIVNTTLNRVGIGTATPGAALEVVGDAKVSGQLNVTSINATSSITVRGNAVQEETPAFKLENFTSAYDSRTDRFGNANYTSMEAASFQNTNFTSQYGAEYGSTGYKKANLSADLAGGTASTIVTTTLTSDTIIVNKNLYVIGNISNTNIANLNVNGSLYPALDDFFSVGNGSSRWKNGNFTGTLQAGTLSAGTITDGTATITGGAVNAADGSAATPAFSFINDPNTGIRRGSADNVSIVTGGSDRVTIDASGNVGIGTTNPGGMLEVSGGNLKMTSGNIVLNGNYLSGDGGNEGVYIDGSGLVGIGTANAGSLLSLFGPGPTSTMDGQLKIESSNSTGAANTGNAIYFAGNSGDFARGYGYLRVMKENGVVGNYGTYMSFGTRTNGVGTIDERVRITSTGNVGIGTTTPGTALHVIGSINASTAYRAADGSAAAPSYTFDADTNTGIRRGSADNVSIVTGGSDRVTVDASGNVGIGTTNPAASAKLHIYNGGGGSAASTGDVLTVENSASGYVNLIVPDGSWNGVLFSDNARAAGSIIYKHIANGLEGMYFSAAGAEKMVINSAGNVGIGQTSPNVTLGVSGSANITGILYATNANITNVLQAGTLSANTITGANIYSTSYDIGWTNLSNYPAACDPGQFMTAVGDTLTCAAPGEVSTAAGGWSNDSVNTRTNLNVIIDTNVLAVNTSMNKVGINTASPATDLDVLGNIRASGSINATSLIVNNTLFVNGSMVGIGTVSPDALLDINIPTVTIGSTEVLRLNRNKAGGYGYTTFEQFYTDSGNRGLNINSGQLVVNNGNGNVGIGVVVPTAKLTITGAGNSGIVLRQDGSAIDRFKLFVGDGTSGTIADENYIRNTNTNLHIQNGAAGTTETVTILVGGNVGIGTTAPLSTLHVNGSGAQGGLRVTNDSSYTALFVNSTSGNVGIGTANPQTTLEVVGTINATSIKIGQQDVQVEANAFKAANFTSQYDSKTDRFVVLNLTNFLGGVGSNDSIIRSTNTTFFGLFSKVADAFGVANLTGFFGYSSISDANASIIQKGNTSWVGSTIASLYPNLDTDQRNDITNNTDAVFNTLTVNKNLYIIGNLTNVNVNNINVNGSILPSLSATFDIGNGSSQWRNANFSGTAQAGTLSDGSATITGGVVKAADGSAATPSFSFINDPNTGMRRGSADNVSIVTGGSDRVTIDASGNVGIGTTSPTSKLQIVGGDLSFDDTSRKIIFWPSYPEYSLGVVAGGDFAFKTQGYYTFTANSGGTGNVGIGTTYPLSTLHVNGSGTNGGLRVTNDSGYTAFFVNSTSGNVGIGTTSPTSKLQVSGVLGISDGDAGLPALAFSNELGTGIYRATTGTIGFQGLGTGMAVLSGAVFRVNSGIPIGWASGSVDGTQIDTGFSRLSVNKIGVGNGVASDVSGTLIAGNIGVGTTSPASSLHVVTNDTNNFSTTTVLTLDHIIQNPLNSTGGIGVGMLFRAMDNGSNIDDVALINATLTNALNGSEASALGVYTRTNGGALTPALFINGSNVGIGTSGPGERLEVSGNIKTTGHINLISDQQILMGTVSTLSRNGGTGTITLATNSNGNIILTPSGSGNVGIGTTTPSDLLEVAGNVRVAGSLNATSVNASRIFARNGTAALPSFTFAEDTNTGLRLGSVDNVSIVTGGSDRVTVDSSGNVGIGTTSPTNKLHVYAGTSGMTPQGDSQLVLENSAVATMNILSPSNSIAGIYLGAGASSRGGVFYAGSAYSGAQPADSLAFTAGGVHNRMVIINTGNVGIGTTAPGKKLEVVGDVYHNLSTVSQDFNIVNATGDSRLFVDNSNGYVGIGTTAPTQRLDVNGSINVSSTIYVSGGNIIQTGINGISADNFKVTGNNNPINGIGIYNIGSGGISFYEQGLVKMVLDDDGNIGIGQTSPNVTLGVSGSTNITGVIYGGSANITGTVQAARFVGDGSLLAGLVTGLFVYSNANITEYLGGTGANDSLIRSTNTTFFGLFSKVADAFSVGNLTSYFGDASFNATVIRSTNTSWFNTNFNTQIAAVNSTASLWNSTSTAIFQRDLDKNVGIGTTTPSKALVINSTTTANAITLDPSASTPTVNTTGGNMTLTSASGSVIIRLG